MIKEVIVTIKETTTYKYEMCTGDTVVAIECAKRMHKTPWVRALHFVSSDEPNISDVQEVKE